MTKKSQTMKVKKKKHLKMMTKKRNLNPKKDKGDLKKNPKTADKKAEISKIESVKTEEAFKSFWNAEELLEKRKSKERCCTIQKRLIQKNLLSLKSLLQNTVKDEKENDSLSKDNKKGEDATKPKSGKRPADSTVGEAKSLVDLAREVLAGDNPNAFAEMKGEKVVKKESNPYDGRTKDAKVFSRKNEEKRLRIMIKLLGTEAALVVGTTNGSNFGNAKTVSVVNPSALLDILFQ